jgi:mRNA interferase RelE/StbE
MARYRLVFRRSVAKDFRKIAKKDVRRILSRIEQLADDPRPSGALRLTGIDLYRIRQGNYRILYTIEDEIVTVTVVRVAHRRDVFR